MRRCWPTSRSTARRARRSTTAASPGISSCSIAPTASRCCRVDEKPVADGFAAEAAAPTQPFPSRARCRDVPRLAEARSEEHPGQPVARGAELQRLSARRDRQPGLHRAQLPRPRQAVRDYPAGVRRDAPQGLHVRHALGPAGAVDHQPERRPDWSSYSFSHKLDLLYIPYGVNPVAHWRGAGGNGQRALGQYQTGGILAIDAVDQHGHAGRTTRAWTWAHGQGPLSTASDLVFVGQFDGNFLALDAVTGKELWRFQTGAAISAGADHATRSTASSTSPSSPAAPAFRTATP